MWQQIETAPKDGTRILVFDGADMYVARWDDNGTMAGKGWISDVVAVDYNIYLDVFPTHWVPLPEKPGV